MKGIEKKGLRVTARVRLDSDLKILFFSICTKYMY